MFWINRILYFILAFASCSLAQNAGGISLLSEMFIRSGSGNLKMYENY